MMLTQIDDCTIEAVIVIVSDIRILRDFGMVIGIVIIIIVNMIIVTVTVTATVDHHTGATAAVVVAIGAGETMTACLALERGMIAGWLHRAGHDAL